MKKNYSVITGKKNLFLFISILFSLNVFSQVPTIGSFAPISAPKGASIIITGTNFDVIAANNKVFFGANRAAVTAASVNSLTVTVPGCAIYGPISVTCNNSIAYSALSFVPSFSYCGSPEVNTLSWENPGHLLIHAGSANSGAAIIGDIDGDGKSEIIYSNGDSVRVHRNTSTVGVLSSSSFATSVNFLAGSGRGEMQLRDIDVDGKLDLIVSSTHWGGITAFTILRNTSTLGVINLSSFAPLVSFTMPNSETPTNIAFGDLDGDGKGELAVTAGGQTGQTSGSTNLVVYRNISTPGIISTSSFAAPVSFPIVTNGDYLEGLKISDMDLDGKADVVVASSGNNAGVIKVLKNTSVPGTVSFASSVSITTSGSQMNILLGDLDLDGKTDILYADKQFGTYLTIFKNNCAPGIINSGSFVMSYTTSSNTATEIADVNGDGKPDIINGFMGFSILLNFTTPGTINASLFTPFTGYNNSNGQYANIGDLDWDGMPDFIGKVADNVARRQATLPVTTPDICMVTVDSLSINNEIYWDKSLYPNLDSMIIYREVTSNVYKRIGAVSKNALSIFTDVNRSVGPANGDPNIGTYRYKIKARDNCGNFSALSLWHNTVFFINSSGTFFWNEYKIETSSTPINPMTQFDLVRDDFAPTGNFNTVGTVAGTQTTLNDPLYVAYQNTADWRVYAYGLNCVPTFKLNNGTQGTIVKSRSNIKTNRAIGITDYQNSVVIKVYPNPATDEISIQLTKECSNCSFEISDALGQILKSEKLLSLNNKINISSFANGVYYIKVKNDASANNVQKIVVQR